RVGDKIKTGQTIGEVDTINGETQLHFQIWKNQTPQDPEKWLR
ncbi:MAG: M23 family metallopeptidase, partial [Bacteroidetes bacterium]|nr:M23 family metallopeptidase [Candidatus Cryptobacteroides faecigallinarum]